MNVFQSKSVTGHTRHHIFSFCKHFSIVVTFLKLCPLSGWYVNGTTLIEKQGNHIIFLRKSRRLSPTLLPQVSSAAAGIGRWARVRYSGGGVAWRTGQVPPCPHMPRPLLLSSGWRQGMDQAEHWSSLLALLLAHCATPPPHQTAPCAPACSSQFQDFSFNLHQPARILRQPVKSGT